MRTRIEKLAFSVSATALFSAGILALQGVPAYGQGRGGGNNRALATFPAQQRPPGDPVEIAHGKTLYDVDCQKCHGADLRGNLQGGTSLLRSGVVLGDQHGELIAPIIAGSMSASGMPGRQMPAADAKAIAEYLHAVVATEKTQGSPPEPGIPAPSALVGNATAGKVYFDAHCASCHSVTGDLQGFGTKYPDAKAAQNRWVSGGGSGRGRGAAAAGADRRTVTVTVTPPTGPAVEGPLVQLDDFLVSLTMPDGSERTFRRDGDVPKVEVKDPMQGHKTLLDTLKNKDMHDVTAYLETLK